MLIKDFFPLRLVDEVKEVGVEVEMEGRNLPHTLPSYWGVKGDGSLRGAGVEYALNNPVNRSLVGNRIKYLYRKLTDNSTVISPSDRCGVHIHINCQHMSMVEVHNYIILYLIFEDLLVNWCGEEREGNLFCLRAKDAEYLIFNLILDREAGLFHQTVSERNSKYASINIASLRKFGSLEFRALQTPTDYEVILKWIDMLFLIKEASLKIENPIEFIVQCSEMGPRSWLQSVLASHYNEFVGVDVDGMLMDGVRRVQMLAYTEMGDFTLKKLKGPSPPLGTMEERATVTWRMVGQTATTAATGTS